MVRLHTWYRHLIRKWLAPEWESNMVGGRMWITVRLKNVHPF
jgi:hypothetical protein